MIHVRNQCSDYSVVEVGWHDFLLGPTTSTHKLPPLKAHMKERLPHARAKPRRLKTTVSQQSFFSF